MGSGGGSWLLGLLMKLILNIPTNNAHKKNHRRVLEFYGARGADCLLCESHAESAAKRGKVSVGRMGCPRVTSAWHMWLTHPTNRSLAQQRSEIHIFFYGVRARVAYIATFFFCYFAVRYSTSTQATKSKKIENPTAYSSDLD